MKSNKTTQTKLRRAARSRARITGTLERPRLAIFRSNKSVYAQLIDDEKGNTLFSASSKEMKGAKNTKTQLAEQVGELLAKKALDKGVKKVVFDRRGYQYHGRVKALAEGARKGGLEF